MKADAEASEDLPFLPSSMESVLIFIRSSPLLECWNLSSNESVEVTMLGISSFLWLVASKLSVLASMMQDKYCCCWSKVPWSKVSTLLWACLIISSIWFILWVNSAESSDLPPWDNVSQLSDSEIWDSWPSSISLNTNSWCFALLSTVSAAWQASSICSNSWREPDEPCELQGLLLLACFLTTLLTGPPISKESCEPSEFLLSEPDPDPRWPISCSKTSNSCKDEWLLSSFSPSFKFKALLSARIPNSGVLLRLSLRFCISFNWDSSCTSSSSSIIWSSGGLYE